MLTVFARSEMRGDSGSSLLLMPAAMMIVLVLGAISVDLSVVHLRQRDLIDVASSAANDAVSAGLDPTTLRTAGRYRVDLDKAEKAVRRTLEAHLLTGRARIVSVAAGPNANQVTVELSMPVEYIFAKSIPGTNGSTTVHARATATAERR